MNVELDATLFAKMNFAKIAAIQKCMIIFF